MSQEGKKEKGGEGVEKERKKRKKKRKKKLLSSSSVEIMFGELYTFDLCSIL